MTLNGPNAVIVHFLISIFVIAALKQFMNNELQPI